MEKKKIIAVISYIVIVALCFMLFLYKFELSESGYVVYDTLENEKGEVATQKINDGDIISQKIDIQRDKLKYAYIYFNTQDVENKDGMYTIEFIDQSGNVVLSDKISYIEASRNNRCKIKVDKLVKGSYTMSLTYEGEETNFVPLVNSIYEDNNFSVNNTEYKGLIQTKLLYVNKIKTILFYTISCLVLAVISIISFFTLKSKEERVERKFLYIAIPIFLMYMIFLPLYVGHDELFHWYRVFEITEGGILPQIQDGSTGYVMPDAITSSLPWGNLKYKNIIIQAIKNKIDYSNSHFISDVTMSVYSPIQYLPQVIGVIIGKVITNRPILISYFGRLSNLLICIFLLYYAIKKMPYGKNLLFIFAFIPIAIEGFVTLSGDGFTISTALLFIAYILDIRKQKKKLNKKDYVILCALGVILAFCKIIYIPIVFMLLTLPKESFESNKKRYIYSLIMILAFVCCNLLWLKLANPYLNVYTDGKSGYQISYILSNPIRYCQNFLYTIQNYGIGYIQEMFGSSLLWGSAIQNNTFVPLILIGLVFFVCLNEEELKRNFDIRDSIIVLLIILAVIALMFTSLYVQWTGYAQETIEGVQGRYFLPIISLIFLFIGNFIGRKSNLDKRTINNIVIIGCALANFMCLMEFLVKYI